MIVEERTSTTRETVLTVSLGDRTLELKIEDRDDERRYVLFAKSSGMSLPFSLDEGEIEALQCLLAKARYNGLIPPAAETVIAGRVVA